MKLPGFTKYFLDSNVGIHPTQGEEFTMLEVSKSSSVNPEKESC
jgi:hypothetical protein